MKANELRLGNLFWVLHEESETVTTAAIQHLQSLQQYEDDPDDDRWSRGGPNDYYTGIPFTEDWLRQVSMATGDIFWVNFSDDNGGYFIWVGGFKVYLKYVHQLQNLYFSLTGTELKLKEQTV